MNQSDLKKKQLKYVFTKSISVLYRQLIKNQ